MADDMTPREAEKGRKARQREPATIDLTAQRIAEAPAASDTPVAQVPVPAQTEPQEAAVKEGTPREIPVQETAVQEIVSLEAAAHDAPAAVSPDAAAVESAGAPARPEAAAASPADAPAESPAEAVPVAQAEATPEQIAEPVAEPVAAEAAPEPAPEPIVTPPVRQAPPQRGLPAAIGFAGGLAGGAVFVLLMAFVGPLADAPDRLTAVEGAVGDKATRRTVDALDKRVATAESAAQGLRTDIDGLMRRPQLAPSDLSPLTQRLDRLDRAVAQLAARPAGVDAGAAPAAPVPLPPVVVAGRESAALAVAMLVRDAVARGTPYGREIAALETSGLQPDAVAKLKPFAAGGAPGGAALATALEPLVARISAPPEPPPNAGWTERLQALAARVVKVRPTGAASGEDPGAVAARAEAALRRGDLPAAQALLASLPAPAKATVQPVADRLAARLAAGQAADSLVAAAVDQVIAATAQSGVPAR